MLHRIARMRLQKPGDDLGAAETPRSWHGAVAGAVEAVDGSRGYTSALLIDDEAPDGQPRALALHAEEGDLQRHLLPHVHAVERLINRLKQGRRTATRYGKRAANDPAMLLIAAITLWL
jgi:hypothetical protein